MQTKYYLFLVIAIIVLAAGIFFVSGRYEPTGAVVVETGKEGSDYFKGNEDAPVTVLDFSDYQCPACQELALNVLPKIQEAFIKQGKVKWVFKDFPLNIHAQAKPAALAARCAGDQGKFWEMHDKLFANQMDFNNINFKRWAGELGLSVAGFGECLDGQAHIKEIEEDTEQGKSLGIRGTPAVVIKGKTIYGACPFETYEKALNAELEGRNWGISGCEVY